MVGIIIRISLKGKGRAEEMGTSQQIPSSCLASRNVTTYSHQIPLQHSADSLLEMGEGER